MKAEEYALALFQAIREVRPQDHEQVLENFVKILGQDGAISLYPQIEEEYGRLAAEEEGIKQVEVITAQRHNSKELISALNKIVGSKVVIKEKINQDIIGGVVIKVDDTLIDGSIQNSLKQLRKAIIK